MKKRFIAIILALLCGQANAAQLRFPTVFDGMTITTDMVRVMPPKDGLVLVALRVTVPPQFRDVASPMFGYREDMWSSGQLRVLPGLSAEQSYRTLFCATNRDNLGLQCKNTAEIMSVPRDKPWWIPVIMLPQEEVSKFTSMVTSGPIPPSMTRVAGNVQSPQPMLGGATGTTTDRSHVPQMAPRRLEVYLGPVPEYLRRDKHLD